MTQFSVVIPSVGRPSLRESLLSCDSPLVQEILVSPDGRHAHTSCDAVIAETPLEHADVCLLDPIDESRMNQRGHPQRNRATLLAGAPWLCFLDDDDVFVDDAFTLIALGLNGYRPHLFRMRVHNGTEAGRTLWDEPELRECNVGTPMFVVPNRQMGWWPSRVAGDFYFIEETCKVQGDPVFVDTVIAEVRPNG